MCKVAYRNVLKVAKMRLEYNITTRVARTRMMLLPNSLVKKTNFRLRRTMVATMIMK